MKDKLRRVLVSPKTVIALIVITLLASLAGVLVPQSTFTSPQYFVQWKAESPYIYAVVDFVGLNRVFSTVWFFMLVLVMTVVLGYSVLRQFTALIKGRRRGIARWGSFFFTPACSWSYFHPFIPYLSRREALSSLSRVRPTGAMRSRFS